MKCIHEVIIGNRTSGWAVLPNDGGTEGIYFAQSVRLNPDTKPHFTSLRYQYHVLYHDSLFMEPIESLESMVPVGICSICSHSHRDHQIGGPDHVWQLCKVCPRNDDGSLRSCQIYWPLAVAKAQMEETRILEQLRKEVCNLHLHITKEPWTDSSVLKAGKEPLLAAKVTLVHQGFITAGSPRSLHPCRQFDSRLVFLRRFACTYIPIFKTSTSTCLQVEDKVLRFMTFISLMNLYLTRWTLSRSRCKRVKSIFRVRPWVFNGWFGLALLQAFRA